MSASMTNLELTDSHRLFLQGMMWRRICDYKEITTMFKKSLQESNVPLPADGEMNPAVYDFVMAINAAIKPLNLSIVKCIDELIGKHYYALISRSDNNISHLSSDYTQQELELFKKIIESIVYSNSGSITSTQVLNLTSLMEKRINKTDAQEMLKKFHRDKWLCWKKDNTGILYLSPRCIAELDYYLTRTYEDVVVKCFLCQHTVIQAVKCALCMVKLHHHCKTKYLAEQTCCPKCHKTWKEYSTSNEEEEEDDDEEMVSSSARRGRKRVHQ